MRGMESDSFRDHQKNKKNDIVRVKCQMNRKKQPAIADRFFRITRTGARLNHLRQRSPIALFMDAEQAFWRTAQFVINQSASVSSTTHDCCCASKRATTIKVAKFDNAWTQKGNVNKIKRNTSQYMQCVAISNRWTCDQRSLGTYKLRTYRRNDRQLQM